jgi:hypothetical protein
MLFNWQLLAQNGKARVRKNHQRPLEKLQSIPHSSNDNNVCKIVIIITTTTNSIIINTVLIFQMSHHDSNSWCWLQQ